VPVMLEIKADDVDTLESETDDAGWLHPGAPTGALYTQGIGAPGLGVINGGKADAGLKLVEPRARDGRRVIKRRNRLGTAKLLLAELVLVFEALAVGTVDVRDAESDVEADISDSVRVVEKVKRGSVRRLVLTKVEVV
jgi:hypothetical protein